MSALYRPDATFEDSTFSLRGPAIADMWRMFCRPAEGLRIEYSSITADDRYGSAHWEAFYRFPATSRAVHNVIDARFEFVGGLIAHHRDVFDMYRWTRQALGSPGLALGWTPYFQARVRSQAASQLRRFQQCRDHPQP